ncbi:MAG: DUF4173 domain-containing protein [Clostridiales bacterium]|nr:DUF4173 domain-containing protein [Clostridiales bacterium]
MEGILPVDAQIAKNEPGDQDAPKNTALPFDRDSFLFALLFSVLGFLFIKLIVAAALWRGHLGAGVPAFTFCYVAGNLIWLKRKGAILNRPAVIQISLVLLLSLYFLLYQNPLLETAAFFGLLFLAAYTVVSLGKGRVEDQIGDYIVFDLFFALLSYPFGHFGKLWSVYRSGFEKRKSMSFLLVLLGVLLTLPVCLYVAALLQDADAAFGYFWTVLTTHFHFENFSITLFQILISLPVSMYLFGLAFAAVHQHGHSPLDPEGASRIMDKAKALPYPMVIGGITPLLLLYTLFFLSQSAYFLSAFRGVLPQGMLYSEYARRGFFELCTISVINLLMTGILLFFTKKANNRLTGAYCSILSVMTVALILISLSKMFLYIAIYGLTPLRVYTSWFMLFLLIVFSGILVKVAVPGYPLMKYTACAAMGMLLILCYADTDRIIARYNLAGYRSGKLAQLDLSLLGQLGSSATPYLLEIMEDGEMEAEYRDRAREIWQAKVRYYEGQGYPQLDWRHFSVADAKLKKLMQDRKDAPFREENPFTYY